MSERVLPEGWRNVTLGDLCSHIVDCEHKTAPTDASGEHFAVGTPAMRGNVIDFAQARRISASTFGEWTRRLEPAVGDLLLAREAPVGPVVRIPDALNVAPGQRTVLLRPDAGRCDSRFLYLVISSPQVQADLGRMAEGSTVRHLNVVDIRRLLLCGVPPLDEQRAIAEVLGALDDKIAANRRIAELVQQLAATEFAAAVSVVKGSGKTFDEVAVVGGGGTPKTSIREFWDGGVAWLTPTDVTALEGSTVLATSRTLTESGMKSCASPLYPEGTIFMTSRATIGAMAVAGRPMAVNQGFIAVQPPSGLRWWLFHEMRSRVDEFLSWANGATFMELSRGTFRRLPVRLADPETISMFESRAEALHAKETTVIAEVNSLAATRDALLPALMSGRLTVRDAERVVADAT